jgi:glycerophosphoryl diester phosphodiesterase
LVVAHRGASSSHPENTLVSFEAAVAVGADVIELDVRMSNDGVAVVMHNADVSATTDGTGYVHELSLAQLKRLDASHGIGAPTSVPTLDEALELLSGRIGLDIEVKNLPGDPGYDGGREAAAEAIVEALARTSFDGPVLVTSFNPESIARIRGVEPEIPTGFLSHQAVDPASALRLAREGGHAFVLPQAGVLMEAGRPFVDHAHGAGVRVGTWTVDDADDLRRLFELGVDAVATNDPEAALPVRDGARAARA